MAVSRFLVCLTVFSVSLFGWTGTSVRASCEKVNFEFTKKNSDQIFRDFTGATIRIKSSDGEVGTGFLIDSKQGYVLTAAHVISGAKNQDIHGTVALHGKQDVTLKFVDDLTRSNIDLALLRLDPPDKLSWVKPVDVSFRPPRGGEAAYVMGYSRGVVDLSRQTANVTQISEDGLIVVKAADYPGDSGGPLFLSNGLAIGVAKGRIDVATARYTPMYDALDLLEEIATTKNINELDDHLRKKEIDQDSLADELVPEQTVESSRNVELISWAMVVGEKGTGYQDFDAMFACPILRAYFDREIGGATQLLLQVIKRADLKANIAFRVAEDAAALRKTSLATEQFADALGGFSAAITDHIEKNPDALLYSFCQSGDVNKLAYRNDRKIGQAKVSPISDWLAVAEDRVLSDPYACAREMPDREYASLLEDYSRAGFEQSKFKTTFTRERLLTEATRTAAASIAASEPKGTSEEARRFSLLGDLLYQTGSYQKAADAFASAYKVSYDQADDAKWTDAVRLASANNPDVSFVREHGIARAPTLSTSDLVNISLGYGLTVYYTWWDYMVSIVKPYRDFILVPLVAAITLLLRWVLARFGWRTDRLHRR